MRRTIQKMTSRKGKGLHTGKEVTISLLPLEEPKGILFLRKDIGDEKFIPADIANIKDTHRHTTLTKGDVDIETVEHVMAALYANNIQDVIVEIDGPEVPVFDGSASVFVEMIEQAGVKEWGGTNHDFFINEEIKYYDEESGAEYILIPSAGFEITTLVDFPDSTIGFQYASLNNLSNFNTEIADSRTFVMADDLQELAANNLIAGGDLSNALIIDTEKVDKEKLVKIANTLGLKDISFDSSGRIRGQKWRSNNEPARHKLLDLIGDLALLGVRINGKLIAKRPGHNGNIAFTSFLKKKYQEYKRVKDVPKYDPTIPPIVDAEGIISMLPHRYPFLLVDKIIELTDTHVVGIKNITFNEEFFQGHFPGNPIFPGVLQMEALAQTGGILALNTVEVPSMWDTYFLKMDKVKFKNKVVPGDTLILKMELLSPIRRGIVQMQGTAYVGNKMVSEGELVAQIVKREI